MGFSFLGLGSRISFGVQSRHGIRNRWSSRVACTEYMETTTFLKIDTKISGILMVLAGFPIPGLGFRPQPPSRVLESRAPIVW